MEINMEVMEKIKQDLRIPDYVIIKMKELGIEELPSIKNLVVEYMLAAGDLVVDWYYFNQWVAMGYSDH